MMENKNQIAPEKWAVEQWLCFVLMGVAIAVGFSVPRFYDWTGADQSRPAPVVGWVAIGIILVDCLLVAVLLLLHFSNRDPKRTPTRDWQFSTSHLLLATMSIAVFMAIVLWKSLDVACLVLHGLFWCYAVSLAIRFHEVRWRIMMLLVCQSTPFLWILRSDDLFKMGPAMLAMVSGLPVFFPTIFVSSWMQRHFERMLWLSATLTMIELAIGLWLCFRGPKRTLVYGIGVLTLSIFGSFILNALMRA